MNGEEYPVQGCDERLMIVVDNPMIDGKGVVLADHHSIYLVIIPPISVGFPLILANKPLVVSEELAGL